MDGSRIRDRETREWMVLGVVRRRKRGVESARVAQEMGWSVRYAQNVLNSLVSAGVLEKQARGPTHYGEGRRPTLYRVV